MESLANYGSDDDCEDIPDEKKQESRSPPWKDPSSKATQADANYEEVQMDLSEQESDESASDRHRSRRYDDRKSSRDNYRRRSGERKHHRRDEERDRKSRHRRSPRRSRSRSPKRNRRSRSHERNRRDRSNERAKRYERASDKIAQLEKLDSQFLTPAELQRSMDEQKRKERTEGDKDRFFMPGITGRFRDQIERRKLLWQKKEPERKDEPAAGTSSRTGKVWETTTFAQDQDGKVASKFKRLMGIRGQSEGGNPQTDVLKKQEEMFSSMEQQYEVARTATHTMRGVGLGFGSFQR